jgi:hypothetical protein
MSRSLTATSLKEEDSRVFKMRVPQQSREFFTGGISSAGLETVYRLSVYGDFLAHDDLRSGLI